MKQFIFVTAILLSTNSNADVLADIKASMPNATAAEVLEQLYTTANQPAQLSDFDLWGEPSNMKCSSASGDTVYSQVAIPKRIELLVPGRPAQGPLFPGTPDRKLMRFVQYGMLGTSDNRRWAESVASSFTFSVDQNDFKAEMTSPNILMLTSLPVYHFIRKNQNYIIEKSVLPNEPSFPNPIYTYCWRE